MALHHLKIGARNCCDHAEDHGDAYDAGYRVQQSAFPLQPWVILIAAQPRVCRRLDDAISALACARTNANAKNSAINSVEAALTECRLA